MIMKHLEKRDKLRRKLIGLLPRSKLEDMSRISRPWLAHRTALVAACVEHWDSEDIAYEITQLVREAG